jgi:hypothetical protein
VQQPTGWKLDIGMNIGKASKRFPACEVLIMPRSYRECCARAPFMLSAYFWQTRGNIDFTTIGIPALCASLIILLITFLIIN